MITPDDLNTWFTYHMPTTTQKEHYQNIRLAAYNFANVILDCTPSCPDQTTAIRKIREAVMTANAAVACEGR